MTVPDAWQPLLRSARTQRRLVARLAARVGPRHLALVEDAVQTAVLRALERWPAEGVPAAPEGWLWRVAQRQVIDALRRGAWEQPLGEDPGDAPPADTDGDTEAADGGPAMATTGDPTRFAAEIDDDELALLLATAHPALPAATQVALGLRTLAALPLADVARALLSTEAAVAQRLARARQALAGVSLALPTGDALAARRDAALTVLSLLFLAGQRAGEDAADGATGGPGELRADAAPGRDSRREAAWEAVRLARALAAHPATAHPDAEALAATLLLHGARLTGRQDARGEIVPLPGQARDRWDRGMIRLGLHHLQRARGAARLSRWHLLAGIAAEHAAAPSYEATRWSAIAGFYDTLLRLDGSAAPSLGHAIALVESGAVEAGRARLQALRPLAPPALRAHVLAALARADERQGRVDEARRHLEAAIAAAPRPADARLLARRHQALGGHAA